MQHGAHSAPYKYANYQTFGLGQKHRHFLAVVIDVFLVQVREYAALSGLND
jgi:hypothetical protein